MFENISNWISRNSTYITWWIIGWLSFACLDQLGRGHYVMAFIDAGLAYLNYRMWRSNNV